MNKREPVVRKCDDCGKKFKSIYTLCDKCLTKAEKAFQEQY